MPGAFNALCARAIARAGFQACYISGAATSVCAGVPDVGLLTLEHFARVIREAADASGLPVLADADTGFGEAEMVRRTVIEYARAGAAGLHLEDQEFPKRCGHLDGKELVPVDHMCEKIEWAARAAREMDKAAHHQSGKSGPERGGSRSPSALAEGVAEPSRPGDAPGFIICARTDARGVEGFEAAVSRAKAYAQAGAEMIFPEGLQSEDEFARFARALLPEGGGRGKGSPSPDVAARSNPSPGPSPQGRGGAGAAGFEGRRVYLLANMTEFGKTPIIALERFEEMGYSCVIYPVSLLRVAMGAVTRALEQLKRDGSVAGFIDQMQTRKELYELIGYRPGTPWEWPV